MFDPILNILTLGIRPLYVKQKRFHDLILEYRTKFSNPGRANLVQTDMEEFYSKLGDLNFDRGFFKAYYIKYIDHLERFKPGKGDIETSLRFLQIALADNKWKPTKPFLVMRHYLKYEFKLTANPFISYQKKQQRKKLGSINIDAKTAPKPKGSQNWQRVPIKQTKDPS